jgi:hypothetical protein
VLAILSDEEGLGGYGAQYLAENHAALFKGIHYAIGEFWRFYFLRRPTEILSHYGG